MASKESRSTNFAFLADQERQLEHLGALAERYFSDDPSTCLIKLRQMGEVMAQRLAARLGLYTSSADNMVDLLGQLGDKGVQREVLDLFHGLRKAGNAAAHSLQGDPAQALHHLKMARQLAIWFYRTCHDRAFKPQPFVPPPDPKNETAALAQELESLRKEAAKHRTAAEKAASAAAEEARQRLTAEERARKETEDRALWEALAEESGREQARLADELAKLQAAATQAPPATVLAVVEQAKEAAGKIELDEADTRRLIDQQLRDAGWEADTQELRYSRGTRPQKGKNLAIAEWPTSNGPADYVLFAGLQPIGVVEAKREHKNVASVVQQSGRYSIGYTLSADQVAAGGPWGDFKVPFLFATNGRPFLRQLKEQSGIWFRDARRAENLGRPLEAWYTPDGLLEVLKQDIDRANEQLKIESTAYLGLRDYQLAAIRAVEKVIEDGKDSCLLAMATGTGKTKTAIGLVYRLLKTRRFRRVLFLVDRGALGEQAGNAFKETRLENLQTFADIFELKELKDVRPEPDTKVHIATIQGMVKRVLYPTEDTDCPPVDQYDCIVVDECHRGYLLDRELGEQEMKFRDEADYISKYRRVLDHFDAVKIGLTATPALHTTEIFGRPAFQYSYREAVIDGVLIDHEPPVQIVTARAEDGIIWKAGETLEIYNATMQTLDTVLLPDEVNVEIDSFNRRVITENFNRAVCEELAKHIDPSLEEKTLVFCVNDSHADMAVRLLKEALAARYGAVEDGAVLKITGAADKPLQLIRRYRNERNPSIAVTVDLLTTGIDIPAIANLVFLRRIRSRILYEQMLGRATRRCDDIGKEVFRIYDAVNLYAALEPVNTMKPVVQNPKLSFTDLVKELTTLQDPEAQKVVVEQILAKLQAKKSRIRGTLAEKLETAAGQTAAELIKQLRAGTPQEAAAWFTSHVRVAEILDESTSEGTKYLVSHHPDEVRRVERGYGSGEKPGDYLEHFASFLKASMNAIPALLVVMQRPRDLTRQQLKELKLLLDQAGYGEVALQTAYRETTNQDVAATIIGFIRRAALGDALVPYAERVDRALKCCRAGWLMASRSSSVMAIG